MDKKELRRVIKIDMKKFLKRYYGVTNEELLVKLSKLSHRDLKEITPLYGINLHKICFESVTREMLASGEIILVTDGFEKTAPYINPMISLNDEFLTTLDEHRVSYLIKRRG